MVRESKRVRLTPDSELASLAEEVRADNEARILEKDGEEIAAIVPISDSSPAILRRPARKDIERGLAAAGSWKGIVPDDFAEKLMERRHASPPSPPVEL